jgi:hypothetical protein
VGGCAARGEMGSINGRVGKRVAKSDKMSVSRVDRTPLRPRGVAYKRSDSASCD